MPRLASETTGTGDQSWLGSAHAIWNGRTVPVDVSAFTAGTHYPDGYLPSGTPCGIVGGKLVPYTSAEATTTGAGVLAGFILRDHPVSGTNTPAAPLIDHGRVKAAKVPHSFTAPVAAAKRANVTIVFV